MILRERFFAITLLVVMVFNICKIQIPYIQYGIFKNYIAKNLCVNKEKKGNCCQGKCFLKKQVKLAEENSNENNSTNKKTQNNEVNEFFCSQIVAPKPIETVLHPYINTPIIKTTQFDLVIFVPPKIGFSI